MFEWAHEHYVELQASEKQIGHGLDLWRATLIEAGFHSDAPWKNAKDLYNTIDSIKAGNVPWITYTFQYHGLKPTQGPVPQWMEEMYELNT